MSAEEKSKNRALYTAYEVEKWIDARNLETKAEKKEALISLLKKEDNGLSRNSMSRTLQDLCMSLEMDNKLKRFRSGNLDYYYLTHL